MSKEKVVMYDSPEAASIQTITGWVDRTGRFWGQDEHMARYCGSTHRHCKNNPDHPVHATNGWCSVCRQQSRDAKFAAMPVKEWAGEPLVIFDSDEYFFDEDSLRDFLIDAECELEEFRLCICEPNMPREIDPSDVFSDDLPEDGELRDNELQAAFEALNAAIRKSGPLSWSEGAYAAGFSPAFIAEIKAARAAA